MAVTATRLLTADEFLRLPSTEGKQELVQGEVVEKAPVGGEHGRLQVDVGAPMGQVAKQTGSGFVVVETGFRLFLDPDTVRAPDIAFIAAGRLPSGRLPRGFIDGAPDIAVEVVSPDDTAAEIAEKVTEYLDAGAKRVWVVYPSTRSVMVHLPDRSSRTLRGDDFLSGEDILPGFRLAIGDLFSE
jgi:Uma2 family endonuclease